MILLHTVILQLLIQNSIFVIGNLSSSTVEYSLINAIDSTFKKTVFPLYYVFSLCLYVSGLNSHSLSVCVCFLGISLEYHVFQTPVYAPFSNLNQIYPNPVLKQVLLCHYASLFPKEIKNPNLIDHSHMLFRIGSLSRGPETSCRADGLLLGLGAGRLLSGWDEGPEAVEGGADSPVLGDSAHLLALGRAVRLSGGGGCRAVSGSAVG